MTKLWKLRSPSPGAPQLAQETGISLLQAQLLLNRGISDSTSAATFLTPRLNDLIDPMLLKDMDRAVETIIRAIKERERILIYGDYDADGITATALLVNFFSSLDIPVSFYIPNRLTEGYGLNRSAIEKISKDGMGLMITVDCGIADMKEIEFATQVGMKVVVTDHHQVPEDFEPVCPAIDPHRPDSSFPFKNLAGVGLAFFLAIAVRTALREGGWFKNKPEPDLRQYLDLAALGTVADMVPLLDQNRILVKSAIEWMRTSCRPGIKAIQGISALDTSMITPHDLAFKLAPRLNAPGRLGHAEMGIHLLTTDDPTIARDLAGQLNTMNSQRQAIEQRILREIEEIIMSMKDLEHRKTLVLSGNGWHRGVLGIVASRLVDKYHRPTLVSSIEDGMAVGSGRSIDGFNLHVALTRLEHLFERFGGHYHAVGFTLEATNFEILAKELESLAQESLGDADLIPSVEIDGEITLPDLSLETMSQMETLSPFGAGNPEPIFYIHSLEVMDSWVVGKRHLKLKVKQGSSVMEAIGFGLSERHPLQGKAIKMVFTPIRDQWQGYERIQLRIIDLEVMKEG